MCESARQWASLRLDGELSEFEQVLLGAHLSRCDACAAYVVEIGAITEKIRATELEALPQPIALPSRRLRLGRASGALQAAAATAAVIAVTLTLSAQLGSTGRSPGGLANGGRLPQSAITSGVNSEADALIRLPQLVNLKAQYGFVRPRGLQIDT